jgi:hypothetical protein
MKIPMTNCQERSFGEPPHSRSQSKLLRVTDSRSEGGMVTVLFIALLAIMMVFIMVETSSVIRLHREVKLLEQQQVKRLNGSQTNAVSIVIKP